jgi:hypothetical protein
MKILSEKQRLPNKLSKLLLTSTEVYHRYQALVQIRVECSLLFSGGLCSHQTPDNLKGFRVA